MTGPRIFLVYFPRVGLLTVIKVGAGIQIPPNSSRILHDWGLGPRLDTVAVQPGAMIIRQWENGEAIGLTGVGPKFRAMFHALYYVIHRANFHEILHARAHDLGVIIKLGSKVEAYNAGTPLVTLENGQVLIADLIVAADGEILWRPEHWKRLIILQGSTPKRRRSLLTQRKVRNQQAMQRTEQQ